MRTTANHARPMPPWNRGSLVIAMLAVTLASQGIAAALEVGCPGYSTIEHWPKGTAAKPTVVRYVYDPSIENAGSFHQRDQIERAIEKWNDANLSNGSHVRFEEAGNEAAQLTFRNNSGEGCRAVANTSGDMRRWPDAHVIITFFPEANCDYPRYYQVDFAGCGIVFQKVALHEIGHTMGLEDLGDHNCKGAGLGKSVMDRFPCGENNGCDVGSLQSSEIGACDQRAVARAFGADQGSGCRTSARR
jgi:hypothetical protein